MTEAQEAFYTLAGWRRCPDCGTLHHPDDLNIRVCEDVICRSCNLAWCPIGECRWCHHTAMELSRAS
jgi:hypothetical protein